MRDPPESRSTYCLRSNSMEDTRSRKRPRTWLSSPQRIGESSPGSGGGAYSPSSAKNAAVTPSLTNVIWPIVPAGRQTRSISSATVWWSGANMAPADEVTTSKLASSNGSFSASPSTHSIDRPSDSASRLPAARLSGVMSSATTSAPRSAAEIATLPVPAATSSTLCPLEIPLASTRTGPSSQNSSFANRW